MRKNRSLLLALGLLGLVLAAWMAFTLILVGSTLAPAQRDLVAELLVPRVALLGLSWLLVMLLAAAGLRVLVRRYVVAPARLLEQTQVLLKAARPQRISAADTPEMQALAEAINELSAQRDGLREDMAQRIDQARHSLQQEKNRLAALVSELSQSVVVCNLDGRIVLYNNRARLQFRALSQAPVMANGAELIGIGRSIYAVFDRQLVAHALESLQERLGRGAATPSAQFVTATRSGQSLRVQMAPVRMEGRAPDASLTMSGFVLMLDNVTRQSEEETQRGQMLHGLVETGRSAVSQLRGHLDRLAAGGLDAAAHERLLVTVRDAAQTVHQQIDDLARQTASGLEQRWPLEDMLASDLLSLARRRLELHCQCPVSIEAPVPEVWLRVDSFSLLQAMTYLGRRLVDELEIRFLQLRLQLSPAGIHIDLIWSGPAVSTETVMTWKLDPMHFGSQRTPLTVRDVMERHGGELWFERERTQHQAFFRFQLLQASAQPQLEAASIMQGDSRPEFYDFDLFQATDESRALDERPLSTLAFTVFDTETTGLNPSQGDEIIQMGAVRIVNGKLLKQEVFEQLVDPGRVIPAASIPIHGITQEMVRGKRRIGEVLPAFHAFAQDTVLVAHNAAFDMKFLQLKEASTGLAFHQPVLDTLLLSAVVHPNQVSHRLEAIAERFNITVLGRHTALGDAMVTAEVLLRLIPLLQARGIQTLGQAREAAAQSYYARLKY